MNISPRVISISSKLFAAVLCLLGMTADAEERPQDSFALSGSVRAAYWNRDKSFSQTRDYGVGTFWLTLRPGEIDGYKGFFDGYLYGDDVFRSGAFQGVAREVFLEKSFAALDVKVGRQIIAWGRADKINPTDSFSTRNMTRLFTDDEDQRLGAFAAKFALSAGGYRFIGIWQPEWVAPAYPIPPQPGVWLGNKGPEHVQKQFGIKVDRSGGDIDWSLSYFNGLNKMPDLLVRAGGGTGIHVELAYKPIAVLGADFAVNLGEYGIRGEMAYTRTSDNAGKDYFRQNSNIYAVLGGDRTVLENVNANVQILYRHVIGYQDVDTEPYPGLLSPAKNQALITQQQARDQFGLSFRPGCKMLNDTLEMEVAAVYWFLKHDSYIRPKIVYAITDKWKAIAGGEIYTGPKDSFFGQWRDISSVFSELRFLF